MWNRPWGRRLAVALTGAAVAVALVSVSNGQSRSARADGEGGVHPFDSVPGLGRSPDAVLRDDAIAYWEAWKRDLEVQECMSAQGFVWEPEAAYPPEVAGDVANYLGVAPLRSGSRDTAVARNDRRATALGAAVRDRYFRALLGESAAAIDFLEESGGQLPPGKSAAGFATGGCRGEADAAVGSVWDLRRDLSDDMTSALDEARSAPDFVDAQDEYQRCVERHGLEGVRSPADVDRALEEGDDRALAVESCSPIWLKADEKASARAEKALLQAHPVAVERQRKSYARALDQIREDSDFLRAVAANAVPWDSPGD
jgi:hypothetical protein